MLRSRSTDIYAAVLYLTGLCRWSWLFRRNRLTMLVYHDPSPVTFRKHIDRLSRWFKFVSLDDFLSGKKMPPWPAVITLDDGYKGNHRLLPIIREHKLNPVIYLNSALVGTNDSFWFEKVPYKLRETLKDLPDELRLQAADGGKNPGAEGSCLTIEQAREMSSAGVEFGSHTRTHPVLVRCGREKIRDEISGSKSELEQKLGLPIKHFSYPNGDYDQEIRGIVKESGYQSARTIRNGCSRSQDDPYQLRANNISDDAGYFKLICQSCGLFALPSMIRTWGEKLRAIPYRKEGSLNVLLTIDSLGVGGAERQMIELAKGLAKTPGMNCQVLAMSDKDHYTALQGSGIVVHRLLRRVKHDPAVFFRIYRLLKKLRPDIVHSWDYMTAIYALPACKLLGIKFVNGAIRYSLNKLDPLVKVKAAVTFPLSDAIVANSNSGLQAHGVGKNPKACVIYNGIDMGRFGRRNDDLKKELGIATAKTVGMVAAFNGFKDYGTYLAAAQDVLSRRNDVTFLAVGDGPTLETIKSMVPSGLSGRILFLGQRQDVESLVSIFDVGVLSSFAEGFPNAVMEYMCCGVPVVATRGGGTEELVTDGLNGYLVDSGAAGAMVQRIELLLDDATTALRLGGEGRRHIQANFTGEKMTGSYISLYGHLLNGKQGTFVK